MARRQLRLAPMSFVPRTLEELQETWPKGLDHISATSIKMAARCPEQWRLRYVKGLKMPPAAVLLQGRADHAAIEHSMRQKVNTQNDLPLGEVQDFFVNSFEQEIESEGGVGSVEVRDVTSRAGKIKVLDGMKQQGQRNVAAYHNQFSPTIQPSGVEVEFNLPVKGLPVVVNGYIDLVGNRDGEGVIIDRKGSGRARYKPEPEWTI
jgi:hypothetical protein